MIADNVLKTPWMEHYKAAIKIINDKPFLGTGIKVLDISVIIIIQKVVQPTLIIIFLKLLAKLVYFFHIISSINFYCKRSLEI